MAEYTIGIERGRDIIAATQQLDHTINPSDVYAYMAADWPQGPQHQDWLDNAPISEIAGWVWEGLRNWAEEEVSA